MRTHTDRQTEWLPNTCTNMPIIGLCHLWMCGYDTIGQGFTKVNESQRRFHQLKVATSIVSSSRASITHSLSLSPIYNSISMIHHTQDEHQAGKGKSLLANSLKAQRKYGKQFSSSSLAHLLYSKSDLNCSEH